MNPAGRAPILAGNLQGQGIVSKRLYKIQFLNQGEVYEVYARGVSHSAMVGFVEIEELVFDEGRNLVVDPTEEKLKDEFADVERSFVPVHAVIRIDEVTRRHASKIKPAEGGNVTPFPASYYNTSGDGNS